MPPTHEPGRTPAQPAPTPRLRLLLDGEALCVRVQRGQVQVELPFDVDFVRLAGLLRDAGYFYAHHPERVDAQGWGPRLDREGYYPYWVWREGRPGQPGYRVVFACPPEEYALQLAPRSPGAAPGSADLEVASELQVAPAIGPRVVEEIRRWVPFLRRASRTASIQPPSPPSQPDAP